MQWNLGCSAAAAKKKTASSPEAVEFQNSTVWACSLYRQWDFLYCIITADYPRCWYRLHKTTVDEEMSAVCADLWSVCSQCHYLYYQLHYHHQQQQQQWCYSELGNKFSVINTIVLGFGVGPYRNSFGWWSGVVVSALTLINEVNLRRARLALRWATVSGFNSRCRILVLICNQPATQGQLSLPSLRGQ